jgi:hypothetical protein
MARGVKVRLVADRRAPCDLQEGVSALAAAGMPIWIDARARVAREKVLIIDRRVTIMGCYNWSKGAAANSDDLNIGSRRDVCATLAGEAGAFLPLRQRVAMVPGMIAPISALPTSVPVTTISTCRLPHCEQTSRSGQSRTGVSAPCRSASSTGFSST